MKIGNVTVNGFAALAPMAGVADRAMREICTKMGAAYTVGELASARGITLGDTKSAELLFCDKNGVPSGSQLFGCEPQIMAEAAKRALEFSPDFIDINMGCPAPKVAGNGGGSALMKSPQLAGEIVSAVASAVSVPITVKMRAGWDNESLNAVELARICEAAGAKAITVHGRTRVQMYAPPVNYDIIKEVKRSVAVPVIANGDIRDGKSAKFVYDYTGCDFVMVGRGAMGQPWIFQQINAYLSDGIILPDPPLEKKMLTLINQVERMREYKGEKISMLEARKHTAWYMKGLKGAADLRRMAGNITKLDDVIEIVKRAMELNK